MLIWLCSVRKGVGVGVRGESELKRTTILPRVRQSSQNKTHSPIPSLSCRKWGSIHDGVPFWKVLSVLVGNRLRCDIRAQRGPSGQISFSTG